MIEFHCFQSILEGLDWMKHGKFQRQINDLTI